MNEYMNIIFEPRKYELDRKKIIAVIDITFAVVKKKPEKKIGLVRGPDFFQASLSQLQKLCL